MSLNCDVYGIIKIFAYKTESRIKNRKYVKNVCYKGRH